MSQKSATKLNSLGDLRVAIMDEPAPASVEFTLDQTPPVDTRPRRHTPRASKPRELCLACGETEAGGKDGGSRGMCRVCYTVAGKMVKAKEITWAELEVAGKAKPPRGLSFASSEKSMRMHALLLTARKAS